MPAARLAVHVAPGSKRDAIVAVADGVVRVRVAAPPEKGKANEALARLLAGCLGAPHRAVTITRGAAGRHKVVVVDGLSTEEALARLSAQAGTARRLL
ncbi:MAG: DUF167 domain-containing protein [Dehalococcoidia bacterium]|nr:DUF167 domain-containing protein [Dehalococcoidia bacterium]